jgi:hypothetical protein
MAKYWMGLAGVVLVGCYCLYAVIFFGWITATSAPAEQQERARELAGLWMWGFSIAALTALILIVRMIFLWRDKRRRRGQVAPQLR